MKQKWVLVLAILFSANHAFAANSGTRDVNELGNPEYIEVTKISDDLVGFKLRNRLTGTSFQLGSTAAYKISDIQSQRSTEKLNVAGAVGLDAIAAVLGLIAVTEAGVTLGLVEIYINSGGAMTTSQLVAGWSGAIGGVWLGVEYLNWANPAYQLRQVWAVGDDVLRDDDITTSNIRQFSKHLAEVLNKIDSK